MELKIYRTEFLEKELRRIFDYYREKANHRIAKKLVSEIFNETFVLKNVLKLVQR